MSEQKLRYGVIAFLDVLGVKEMGNKEEADLVKFADSFDMFVKQSEGIGLRIGGGLSSGEQTPNFELRVISDTMIITGAFKDGHSKELEAFTIANLGNLCGSLMSDAFVQKIYLRGGISIGSFYQKNNLILGRALTEVARYYDQPQMIGVSLAPSAHYVYSTTHPLFRLEHPEKPGIGSNPFVKHDLSLKIGIEHDAWILAWPRFVKFLHDAWRGHSGVPIDHANKYEPSTNRDIIMSYCNDANLSTALKWRNTLKFWDELLPDSFKGYPPLL